MGKQFIIHKAKDGQFYFTLRASNGQVIATSETYHNRADCMGTVKSIRRGAIFATIKDLTR